MKSRRALQLVDTRCRKKAYIYNNIKKYRKERKHSTERMIGKK